MGIHGSKENWIVLKRTEETKESDTRGTGRTTQCHRKNHFEMGNRSFPKLKIHIEPTLTDHANT